MSVMDENSNPKPLRLDPKQSRLEKTKRQEEYLASRKLQPGRNPFDGFQIEILNLYDLTGWDDE